MEGDTASSVSPFLSTCRPVWVRVRVRVRVFVDLQTCVTFPRDHYIVIWLLLSKPIVQLWKVQCEDAELGSAKVTPTESRDDDETVEPVEPDEESESETPYS